MTAVIQRVISASVYCDGRTISNIGKGLVVLLGINKDDSVTNASKLAETVVGLRIMGDESGKMNHPIAVSGGELLVVPQITLLARVRSNHRPDLSQAAPRALGLRCYRAFIQHARMLGIETKTGEFGAYMRVSLINDGPVTIIIDDEKCK